jgi:predicted DNA-binding transcriptional regulator YafY
VEEKRERRGAYFNSLVAYDHGRDAIRHFRIERIEGDVTYTDAEEYRQPEED